jgi:hypothetical protein
MIKETWPVSSSRAVLKSKEGPLKSRVTSRFLEVAAGFAALMIKGGAGASVGGE